MQRNASPSVIGRISFRMSLASLLALVVALFCLADPVIGVAEVMEDHAPSKCITAVPGQSDAPGWLFTAQDLGDETPDLEQLLQPFENLTIPRQPSAAEFPPLRGPHPPHLSPPRLRPPIFRA